MPTGSWCVGVWLLCDASMSGVSTQPKLTVLPHAYRVFVCCCVGVLVYGCMMLEMRGVSTQPKLTVLTHAYWVLVCWCVGVWLLCDVGMRVVSTEPKLTVLPMPTGYWRVGVR